MCGARSPREEVLDVVLGTIAEPVKEALEATDQDEQTALFHAAQAGNANAVDRLLQVGADLNATNKVSQHYACDRDNVQINAFFSFYIPPSRYLPLSTFPFRDTKNSDQRGGRPLASITVETSRNQRIDRERSKTRSEAPYAEV